MSYKSSMIKIKRAPGRPKGSGPKRTYTERLNVPVTPAQRRRYELAAKSMGVPLAEWVRGACESFLAG